MLIRLFLNSVVAFFVWGAVNAVAAPIYLNEANISVSVGSGTSPGSFNNTFSGGQTINKVIDAPSATSEEFHNQATHIWYTADEIGGGLELLFDFGQEYDLNTLHFWNYTSENFDVDNIAFTFFSSANSQVGILDVLPEHWFYRRIVEPNRSETGFRAGHAGFVGFWLSSVVESLTSA